MKTIFPDRSFDSGTIPGMWRVSSIGYHMRVRRGLSPVEGICCRNRTDQQRGTPRRKKGGMAAQQKILQADPISLLKQYGCGPVQFMGNDGLYERHLLFDTIKDTSTIQ